MVSNLHEDGTSHKVASKTQDCGSKRRSNRTSQSDPTDVTESIKLQSESTEH